MKSKRIHGNALSWLDGEIIQLMRQRDRAHKIAKRSGSQNNWHVYIKLRNSVTEQIRSKKIFNKHFSIVGERLVSNATPRGSVDDNIHLTRSKYHRDI